MTSIIHFDQLWCEIGHRRTLIHNTTFCCLQHQIKRLIYTSSPSVTFDGHHQNNTDESAPYAKDWLCHYPHSKALAEKYVLEANDDEELMTCALRPHLIWGPGDHHLIPRLIQRAKSNQLRRVGDGSNLIDTIKAVSFAAAKNDVRHMLNGVFIGGP